MIQQYTLNSINSNVIFNSDQHPILHYVGQIRKQAEYHFHSHKHDDLSEVIYISEGEGTFIIDNKTYVGRKGDIVIYNKGVIHEEFSNPYNPLKTYYYGVGNLYIKGIENGQILPPNLEPVINLGSYTQRFEKYISDIFFEAQQEQWGYETVCQNLLVATLTMIIRGINMHNKIIPSNDKNALANRLKNFIENNYMKNLTLKCIADHFYISPTYVSQVFKKEISISPMKYLIHCRIGEARRLLLTTDLKIHEISKLVGYDNPNYFSMAFKDFTGETPSQFKKHNIRTKLTPSGAL